MIWLNRLSVVYLLTLAACAGTADANPKTTVELAAFPITRSKVDLPEPPAEQELLTAFAEPAFSLYLSITDTDALQLTTAEKDTTAIAFSELETTIERHRLTVPERERGRITCDLYLDQTLPYLAVDYLKMHLRKYNQLKVRYCVKGGEGFLQKLPPFSTGNCYDPPCRKTSIIAEEGQNYLASKGLSADWNVKIFDSFTAKLKPENLFQVHISATDTILASAEPVTLAELQTRLIAFIQADPTRKVVQFQPAPFSSYGQYVACLATINKAYLTLRNEAAQARFQQNYNDLDQTAQRSIRADYPYVVSAAPVW